MKNRYGACIAVAALALISAGGVGAQSPAQSQSQALTLEGDIALWTMSIRPDKTADFERVMAKLRDGLAKSGNPERQKQLAGWKVVRVKTPLPDGNIAYVHVIDPVVAGADYTIMKALYDAFPEERQALYELYRGAFVGNLSLASGDVVLDMSAPGGGAQTPAP